MQNRTELFHGNLRIHIMFFNILLGIARQKLCRIQPFPLHLRADPDTAFGQPLADLRGRMGKNRCKIIKLLAKHLICVEFICAHHTQQGCHQFNQIDLVLRYRDQL